MVGAGEAGGECGRGLSGGGVGGAEGGVISMNWRMALSAASVRSSKASRSFVFKTTATRFLFLGGDNARHKLSPLFAYAARIVEPGSMMVLTSRMRRLFDFTRGGGCVPFNNAESCHVRCDTPLS